MADTETKKLSFCQYPKMFDAPSADHQIHSSYVTEMRF